MKILRGETVSGERAEIATMEGGNGSIDSFLNLCGEISNTVFQGLYVSEGYLNSVYNGQVKVGNLTCSFKISRDK